MGGASNTRSAQGIDYLALRKLHLLLRAKALVAFPGGYGTFDELSEVLTLVQTRKIRPLPIVLVGEKYWRRALTWTSWLTKALSTWKTASGSGSRKLRPKFGTASSIGTMRAEPTSTKCSRVERQRNPGLPYPCGNAAPGFAGAQPGLLFLQLLHGCSAHPTAVRGSYIGIT